MKHFTLLTSLLLISCGDSIDLITEKSSPESSSKTTIVTASEEPPEGARNGQILPVLLRTDSVVPGPFLSSFEIFQTKIENNNITLALSVGNGFDSEPLNWPGVFYKSGCTASLIGPDTLLTAAHCLTSDGSKETLQWAGRTIDITCHENPAYRVEVNQNPGRAATLDHALCYLSGGDPTLRETDVIIDGVTSRRIDQDTLYERIDIGVVETQTRPPITIVGYGCRGYNPSDVIRYSETGNPEYQFYYTDLRYGGIPNNSGTVMYGQSTAYSIDRKTMMQSRSYEGSRDAHLCPGDSGGPLFTGHHGSAPGDDGDRRIIGVNSYINIADVRIPPTANVPDSYYFPSNFAGLSSPQFVSFLEGWATKNKTKVCVDNYTGTKNIVSRSPLCRR